MSGFSYLIIQSQELTNNQLIQKLNLGGFTKTREESGESTFTNGFGTSNEIWIAQYDGCTIINNFELCFGIFSKKVHSLENKISTIYPNANFGAFIFSDSSNSGGYYFAKDSIKTIVRSWDANEIDSGPMQNFERILYQKKENYSNDEKAETFTSEAVNSILGLKPYWSDELNALRFDVFSTKDSILSNYIKKYKAEVFNIKNQTNKETAEIKKPVENKIINQDIIIQVIRELKLGIPENKILINLRAKNLSNKESLELIRNVKNGKLTKNARSGMFGNLKFKKIIAILITLLIVIILFAYLVLN